MKALNTELVNSIFAFPKDLKVSNYSTTLPEKVIQFGEGNFLRAFVDWMIHALNTNNLFNGRVVVVQPIKEGLAEAINKQDGLYTLLLRGIEKQTPIEKKEIISSISRCLNPYTQWEAYLNCAEDPLIEYVISNTTEAGIVFDPADRFENHPPLTFPGKLTAYLYHRFKHFNGNAAKGMVILPCELIDRNGDKLKKTILQFAAAWKLPHAFTHWINEHNHFLNTLVDRVVAGYPKDEIDSITQNLGYSDALLDTGELFHLWVIEGPEELSAKLPFQQAGLNVIWTKDMTPYRTRKVRILNGAHTACVPAAFLYGLDTVGEMMADKVLGKYVRQITHEEIIPSLQFDKSMLTEFADAVLERFQNPYIKHYLLNILLNSSSKYKTRVLPSILEYLRLNKTLPQKLVFSFAAFIAIYKDGKINGSEMHAIREKGSFIIKDDLWVLEFFAETWADFDGSRQSAWQVADTVLKNSRLWDNDLSKVTGLVGGVGEYLYQITHQGMQKTLFDLI